MKQNDYYKQVDYNQVKEFHRVLYAFYSKQKPDFSKLTRFNAFYNPEKKSTSFLGKLMGKPPYISLKSYCRFRIIATKLLPRLSRYRIFLLQ